MEKRAGGPWTHRPLPAVPTVRIINDDCLAALSQLPDACVDAVITDPPYFLDKMASDWDLDALERVTASSQVTSLPAGMKFDPRQGREFQRFMGEVGAAALRVLKPGGFLLSFSAPRLTHRLGVALEDAGFHIRDLWAWIYTQNQAKAMSVARFLDRHDLPPEQRAELEEVLAIWKTPQIKSCIEPIVCAQRPPDGTFLANWIQHGVGLLNTGARVGADEDMFPATLMSSEPITGRLDRAFLVPKPGKAERGEANAHVSVKPLALMAQLVRLTCRPGSLVLDPFNGSGSTGIAALAEGCDYIGIEMNSDYFDLTQRRFSQFFGDAALEWRAEGRHAVADLAGTVSPAPR